VAIIRKKGKKVEEKITCLDMELAVSEHFGCRANLIVPNVCWGMNIHECDLLILRPSGCAVEVEIKISHADLLRDMSKCHAHLDPRIKFLYFAIPKKLECDINLIPPRAGILVCNPHADYWFERVKVVREPKKNGDYKFTEEERYALARLGTMRIWTLKEKIQKLNNFHPIPPASREREGER
jgi:hypothetical protein